MKMGVCKEIRTGPQKMQGWFPFAPLLVFNDGQSTATDHGGSAVRNLASL